MTNKNRQPKVGKAVGHENKGRPAGVITQVVSNGKRFETKPLDEGKTDES